MIIMNVDVNMVMIDFKVPIYVDQICNSSCLSVCFFTKLLFPSELSAVGAMRGVRSLLMGLVMMMMMMMMMMIMIVMIVMIHVTKVR